MYCLVAVSACMSLMFPTIYGIALTGLGDDAKFGAAGLIMAILGGSVLTSKHHRHAYALEYACGKPIIYPAVHLFCGDCHLWTSLLQTRAILKPPDREISNQ